MILICKNGSKVKINRNMYAYKHNYVEEAQQKKDIPFI
jgi:hypothetical protein